MPVNPNFDIALACKKKFVNQVFVTISRFLLIRVCFLLKFLQMSAAAELDVTYARLHFSKAYVRLILPSATVDQNQPSFSIVITGQHVCVSEASRQSSYIGDLKYWIVSPKQQF